MTDTEDSNQAGSEEQFKDIKEKLDNFTSILQKFGLDLITKLGKSESRLNILTDKIDTLEKATIDIKAFSPKLSTIVDGQKSIEAELELIKSLVQNFKISRDSDTSRDSNIQRDESLTVGISLIEEQFIKFKNDIDSMTNGQEAANKLKEIKNNIFEFTGGHRILYEISQKITTLESLEFDDDVKINIKDKISFWINKLKY